MFHRVVILYKFIYFSIFANNGIIYCTVLVWHRWTESVWWNNLEFIYSFIRSMFLNWHVGKCIGISCVCEEEKNSQSSIANTFYFGISTKTAPPSKLYFFHFSLRWNDSFANKIPFIKFIYFQEKLNYNYHISQVSSLIWLVFPIELQI